MATTIIIGGASDHDYSECCLLGIKTPPGKVQAGSIYVLRVSVYLVES